MTYFPLDRDILTSSLWVQGSPAQTKVWFYLMLTADPRTGIVNATIPAIAARCLLSLEETEHALEWFAQPDKYSRTKDHDGRRIQLLDDGRILLLTYGEHKLKDHSTPRVQKFRDAKHETVGNGVKRSETPSETTDTETETNTETSEGEGSAPADEIDPHAFAGELVAEINAHGHNLALNPGLSFAVSNLLACGHPRGLQYANGRTGFTRENLVDAAHGWIVAEAVDRWHRDERDRGSPFTFSRLVLDPNRLGEYAERGRGQWADWSSREHGVHGLEHVPPIEADALVSPEMQAIRQRHRKREADDLAKRKAEREAKPPEGLTAIQTREWYEKRGRKP